MVIRTRKRAYKTELRLNNAQRTLCFKHAFAAIFGYNWGLARRIELYREKGETVNAISLHRELNKLKKTIYPWLYAVSKCAPQEALRDLDKAFANFFAGRAGFPRFKSRKRTKMSFRLTGTIRIWDDRIQLPNLKRIRLKERGYLPTDAHVLSATISERAGRWYVSVLVNEEYEVPENTGDKEGGDLGVSSLITLSDGSKIPNPRALRRHLRKIKRLQRAVSRKQKGSNNRRKAVERLKRAHFKVSNIRSDSIHKATSQLARTKSVVVLEDLNVSGMMKNHRLAQAIGDTGLREFRRQMEYKCGWYGSEVIFAPRFYPSSKRCSACGHVKADLSLSARIYRCDICGFVCDRDQNAAINLKALLYDPLAIALAGSSSESLNAWLSREVQITTPDGLDRCSSMMQESNTKDATKGMSNFG